MTPWTCPGCGLTQQARGAVQVMHRCPARQCKLTQFKAVPPPEKPPRT